MQPPPGLRPAARRRWQRTFMRRTAASFRSHAKRAQASGCALDYDLADLRHLLKFILSCSCCGADLTPASFSLDHVRPLSRAGSHSLANLVACCRSCNLAKGMLTHDEYQALLWTAGAWPDDVRRHFFARLKAGSRIYRGK